jgi:retron-type reverse transcriptase
MLKLAYENLLSKPDFMIPGITSQYLENISIDIFSNISTDLKTEKFQFKSYRYSALHKGVDIFKRERSSSNLLIATPLTEILVQEVMRIILEAIFEPRFKDESHGFRRNRNCHTALKFAKQKFQSSV